MKIFFFILGFFMISLSCFPCGDSEECTVNIETIISSAGQHDHGNHETEACTPFCSCACCAVPVHVQQVYYPKAPAINFLEFKFSYNAGSLSRSSNSIWQPPRVG